jgi:hypothetical protein
MPLDFLEVERLAKKLVFAHSNVVADEEEFVLVFFFDIVFVDFPEDVEAAKPNEQKPYNKLDEIR